MIQMVSGRLLLLLNVHRFNSETILYLKPTSNEFVSKNIAILTWLAHLND